MNDWLYILLIPAVLLLIWLWPESSKDQTPRRARYNRYSGARRRRFHAVSIVPCQNACAAATALQGKRFLANEAMLLPVAGCNNITGCQCSYKHYADRPSGKDR